MRQFGEQVAEVRGRECRGGEGGEPSVTPPRAAPALLRL